MKRKSVARTPGDKMNLVFLGRFPYPHGMAGTKRIQHAIDVFSLNPIITLRVIVLYQFKSQNELKGVHNGVPYETVLGDLYGIKKAALFAALCARTVLALKRAWRPGCKNILYNYGPLAVDNIIPLRYAKRLGYRVVLDVVEDHDVAGSISHTLLNRLDAAFSKSMNMQTRDIASGVVVISRHLEDKYLKITNGLSPIHYRPISIDTARFPAKAMKRNRDRTVLFYSGSFGIKDGLPILLDAFERLAGRRKNLHLVLTGRGHDGDMKAFLSRSEASPYADRVHYRGYLEDEEYYAALNNSDIPCMTRIDSSFAHGGFPFKLGEFLASGKPVVASSVSDVDQFLTDRHNAMLIGPGDCEGIVSAVEYLIDNPESAVSIGDFGRKTAMTVFDSKVQADNLLAFLSFL